MCSPTWKVVFNKKRLEAIFNLKKDPDEDFQEAKKRAAAFRDKRFKNPQAVYLVEKARELGGVGESEVENPTDEGLAERLKALGYM